MIRRLAHPSNISTERLPRARLELDAGGRPMRALSRPCMCEVCTNGALRGQQEQTQTPRTWLSTLGHPLSSISLLAKRNRE